jgi:hypothetical protein
MVDMPSCYGHKERKARKAHKCCECLGTIQSGETYHYHHGVWDGVAGDHKVCMDCEALRGECDHDAKHDDECTPFEYLYESVDAKWSDAPELFRKFIEIKQKRGGIIPKWMADRVSVISK